MWIQCQVFNSTTVYTIKWLMVNKNGFPSALSIAALLTWLHSCKSHMTSLLLPLTITTMCLLKFC